LTVPSLQFSTVTALSGWPWGGGSVIAAGVVVVAGGAVVVGVLVVVDVVVEVCVLEVED
jgi:hypothetical protein